MMLRLLAPFFTLLVVSAPLVAASEDGGSLSSQLEITASANGQSSVKPGPTLSANSSANWTYSVRNTSNQTIENIDVRFRQKLPSLSGWQTICQIESIAASASASCRSSSALDVGVHKWLLVARGQIAGESVEALTDAFVVAANDSQDQNGLQFNLTFNDKASSKPGPVFDAGEPLTWKYTLRNTSNAPIFDIAVRARQKLPEQGFWYTLCSFSSLEPGAQDSCTIEATAQLGRYKALVVASSTVNGEQRNVLRDAFYTGVADNPIDSNAGIGVSATINNDSVNKPGLVIASDEYLSWNYSAENTGDVALRDVKILRRDKLPTLGSWETVCDLGDLAPATQASCESYGYSAEGTNKALLVARGTTSNGKIIEMTLDAFHSVLPSLNEVLTDVGQLTFEQETVLSIGRSRPSTIIMQRDDPGIYWQESNAFSFVLEEPAYFSATLAGRHEKYGYYEQESLTRWWVISDSVDADILYTGGKESWSVSSYVSGRYQCTAGETVPFAVTLPGNVYFSEDYPLPFDAQCPSGAIEVYTGGNSVVSSNVSDLYLPPGKYQFIFAEQHSSSEFVSRNGISHANKLTLGITPESE